MINVEKGSDKDCVYQKSRIEYEKEIGSSLSLLAVQTAARYTPETRRYYPEMENEL